MPTHYHVQTGLAGYGPDAADTDGFYPYRSVGSAAEGIREELTRSTDHLVDVAEGYAESGDFESAWRTHKLTGELDMLGLNLAASRADAPLYKGKPELWRATLDGIIAVTFPLDIDIDGNERLYVWQCDNAECDQDDE